MSAYEEKNRDGRTPLLETARLRLYPLHLPELTAARYRLAPVAAALGAGMNPSGPREWLQRNRIYGAKAALIKQNPAAWLFTTIWLIVDATENMLAGEIGFKGPPTTAHAVELGYLTRKQHRGQGIMTEAVDAMLTYAFTQPKYRVDYVTAFTKTKNRASQRVLEKNGFVQKPCFSPYIYWERAR